MSRNLKRIVNNATNKKYVLGDVLGEGAFGQVREGMRVDTGDKFGLRVAVKIISRRLIKKVRNGNENLKKEIRCIKLVKHENVIKLLDTVDEEDSDRVYLIFELANFLSLQDLCEWVRDKGFRDPTTQESGINYLPFPWVRLLFKQLLQGLQACHSKGVVHRDIKPSNLQLNSDFKLKIIDFGVAETLDRYQEVDTTERFAGTPSFQPPEVANGQRSFCATKVDIWAAGVTLYYMVEGKLPFRGSTLDELYTQIGTGEFSMPQRAETDKQLQELLKGLLNVNPDERWTLEHTLDHSFCDTSALDDKIYDQIKKQISEEDEQNKKTLMRRYLDEEGGDSDDEPSAASTTEEDTDALDQAREARACGHHRSQDLGTEKDEVGKRNDELKQKKIDGLRSGQCVIS